MLERSKKALKSKSWRLGAMVMVLLITFSLIAGLFSACPEKGNGDNNQQDQQTQKYPLTITDQEGRTVTINSVPQKIISLSPGITECLFALGLDDRIAGVTEYCDYPEEALDKPKVGGFSTVDIEKVTEIGPDLILAGDIHMAEIVPALEALNLTVVILEPKSLNDVMEALEIIGNVADVEEVATSIVEDMKLRIKAITDQTSILSDEQKPRVFYILWHNPLMSVGTDTRIHELIVMAGGINIAAELGLGYPTISIEAVIAADPQVIIAGAGHGSGANATYLFAKEDEFLADVSARVNGRVYGLLADLVSRPSPRLVDGLELMAKIIHPEIFGSIDIWQ